MQNGEKHRLRERARSCKRYGLTLEDYDTLLEAQAGVCAICKRPERARLKYTGPVKALAVDHNHETKRVRGLLCASCNRGLGKFGDDPARLRAAAAYLDKYALDLSKWPAFGIPG